MASWRLKWPRGLFGCLLMIAAIAAAKADQSNQQQVQAQAQVQVQMQNQSIAMSQANQMQNQQARNMSTILLNQATNSINGSLAAAAVVASQKFSGSQSSMGTSSGVGSVSSGAKTSASGNRRAGSQTPPSPKVQLQNQLQSPNEYQSFSSRSQVQVHQQLPSPLPASKNERPPLAAPNFDPRALSQQHIQQEQYQPELASRFLDLPPTRGGTFGSPAMATQQSSLSGLSIAPASVSGSYSYPCRSQVSQQQELLQQLSSSQGVDSMSGFQMAKYQRLGDGARLRSQFVFKVLRADSLTDCELACSRASTLAGNNPQDACKSFNYRAYFAAENCELSRVEIRGSMKLLEATHFEQNTQFDFYALDPTTAQISATARSANLFGPAGSEDCVEVSQSCSQDGMEFHLRTSEPFHGRIYTYGFYDSCYVDGDGSTSNQLHISRSNGFPRCGTQQIGDLMTNIVVVQYSDFVQTTRDKKYNLTCYFSGPGEAVVTSNYLDTKIDERSHPLQIEQLPPQNVITSNVQLRVLYRGQPTNTIAVGDLLTFRLESKPLGPRTGNSGGEREQRQRNSIASAGYSAKYATANQPQNPGSQHEIFATNVIAKDPYSGRQVLLIDGRGCPLDPVNVFPELQRTPDGALESEFYAFKIPDSNFLIFQATVRTCRAPCEPVICNPPRPNGSVDSHPTDPSLGVTQVSARPSSAQFSGGIKGGGQLVALSSPSQQLSAPSWGRRKRRSLEGQEPSFDEPAALAPEDADYAHSLGAGESVEHVIPVRPLDQRNWNASSHQGSGVKTLRRPELSEAEQEVKEMFRVYLSRAELRARKREQQELQQLAAQLPAPEVTQATAHLGESNVEAEAQSIRKFDKHELVCLSQLGYYVILTAMLSLGFLLLALLVISLLAQRSSKMYISDSIADSSSIY